MNQSLFAGFQDAQVFAQGPPKIPSGFDGDVKILKTMMFQTQRAGMAFISELEVMTSNHPQHPVGSKLSYFQSLSDRSIAFSNMLAFLVAAVGKDRNSPAQVEEVKQYAQQIFTEITQPQNETNNRLTGKVLHVIGQAKITNKGFNFVKKIWTLATGQAGAPILPAPAPPTTGNMPQAPWQQPAQPQQPTTFVGFPGQPPSDGSIPF